MAIRCGAVSSYDGAPSHAELAARWVLVSAAKPRQAAKQFRVALNTRYALLAQLLGVPQDGTRDPAQIRAHLASEYPTAYAGSPLAFPPRMLDDARRCAIPTEYPPSAKRDPAPGTTRGSNPWDLLYLDRLRDWARRLGDCHLETIREARFAPAVTVRSETLAHYGAVSGSMNLGAEVIGRLRAARAGTATPEEVALVADVIAHEMIHAAGGGNGSGRGASMYRPDDPPAWMTHEEGTAVLGAELHRESLVRDLDLWQAPERLPEPPLTLYPLERETVNVIAHLAAGQLDREALLAGRYGQPGGWDPEAIRLLLDAHTAAESVPARLDRLAPDRRTRRLLDRLLACCEPSGEQITAGQRQRLRERLAAALDEK